MLQIENQIKSWFLPQSYSYETSMFAKFKNTGKDVNM